MVHTDIKQVQVWTNLDGDSAFLDPLFAGYLLRNEYTQAHPLRGTVGYTELGMHTQTADKVGIVAFTKPDRLQYAYVLLADGTLIDGYWFWGGVNWVAVLTVVLGTGSYFAIYNPVSLEAHGIFRYVGASIPVMVGCAIFYYFSMRLAARMGVGGYPFTPARPTTNQPIRVKL